MDRTLYLNEKRNLRVYRDGPSIWIKEDGKASRRVPARLVSRVVIIGNLKCDAGVLTLFTDNDVPVTLISRKGDSVAVVMPYHDTLSCYYHKQKAFLKTEENINRFKDWLYARRRALEIYTLKRLSKKIAGEFVMKGFRTRDYRNIIIRFNPSDTAWWDVGKAMVANLFREMTISCLVKAELDPHIGVLHRRYNFGLALDLCHILEPLVDLQTIQFLRNAGRNNYLINDSSGWSISGDGVKDIVQRFENMKKKLYQSEERLLDNLFELMRELRK
jgi:CRISPR/Cas system-associated endonuclease Cas1